jgi:hypothetical protein
MAKKKDEKKEAKPVEVELVEPLIKYNFSQDELISIGEQVADFAQKLAVLEAESKQVAKQYKADIEGLELQQERFIRLIRDKFEMRKMECLKIIDGKSRKVWFFRTDLDYPDFKSMTMEEIRFSVKVGSLEPVRIRDARASELQRKLPESSAEAGENAEGAEGVATE